MAPIYLTSGAYQSKSIIANAQRCVNLYMEANPENTRANAPTTHYPRPGKIKVAECPAPGRARGFYTATNGDLYAVVGTNVYWVDGLFNYIFLGNVDPGTSRISMADNGQNAGDDLVIVDGSAQGYVVTLSTKAYAPIVDGTGLFTGSDVVCYVQTFFLFNKPGTQNWYTSLSDTVTFNALDIAAKASYADNIVTIGVRQREPWLIGAVSTEPWSLTGAADFAFEEIPSTFVPVGCSAKYSLVSADNSLFWVGRTLQGNTQIFKTSGYDAKRVSTFAIEQQLQKLPVTDAVGAAFQVDGHTFVTFTFPEADLTYVYDVATEQWAQFAYTDPDDGTLHRDRCLLYSNAYGSVLGIDWETGDIYRIDPDVYTDDGNPIQFIRGFPHVLNEMKRVTHWALVADVQCGTLTDVDAEEPELALVYSDDRGQTFCDPIVCGMGRIGEYYVSPQFNNLGMARDRVYEIWWSAPVKTALNGVYIEVEPAES